MRLTATIVLALVLGAAMAGAAGAAPLTVTDRNKITDTNLEALELALFEDPAGARKKCEESRDLAAAFDPDDWAQGHIAGCFANVADAENDTAAACKLRDSQIAHFEKVTASGPEYLKKNLAASFASAKKMRAALTCP
jgi:hypothetical protein